MGNADFSDRQEAAGPLSRRRVIGSLAALGAGAALPLRAQPAGRPKRRLIDVHHHFFPPALLAAFEAYNTRHQQPQQAPFVLNWTPARTLEEMDKNGVATAVLSIASVPDGWFGLDDAAKRQLTRTCNDYAARMMRDHPGRFGLFAALPIPDVEGSLREIEYAFDTLKADGVGIATNYGATWPGDPAYKEIFAELDRRKANVYFHPVSPNCCSGNFVPGVAESVIEYPYDTGRAVLSLLFSGTFLARRNIKWLFSHGGGTIPFLAGRIVTQTKFIKTLNEVAPHGVDAELKRLHYETANAAYAPTMAALLKYVPLDNIMFGSDFPYVSVGQNAEGLESIGLSATQLRAIEHANAMRFVPRLAKA